MNGISFELQRFAIYGSDGNETLSNSASSNVIYAYGGNDSVYNERNNYARIYAGDGADTVYGYYDGYCTIDGGNGNDRIINYGGWYNSMNGGAGNDVISLKSVAGHTYKHTVKGGTGNDTIYSNSLASVSSGGSIYQYASGDGSDIIYGYTPYDTISITDNNHY